MTTYNLLANDRKVFFSLLALEHRSDGWWGQMPGTEWMGPWDDVATARRSIWSVFNVE